MIYFSRFFLFKKEETVFQVFESFFFGVCVWCFAFMYVCVLCVNLVPMKSRIGIKDGCEPPHVWWELNSCPLEEQLILSTAEPSL